MAPATTSAGPWLWRRAILSFFLLNLQTFDPDVGIPLVTVRSHADGSGRTEVRPEVLDVYDVRWSEDRSSAIATHRLDDVHQLILARTDDSMNRPRLAL